MMSGAHAAVTILLLQASPPQVPAGGGERLSGSQPNVSREIEACTADVRNPRPTERRHGMVCLVGFAALMSIGAGENPPANGIRGILKTVSEHLPEMEPSDQAVVLDGVDYVFDDSGVELLVSNLTNPSIVVRRKAAEVLLRIGRRQSKAPEMSQALSSEAVLKAVSDTDAAVRRDSTCILALVLESMEYTLDEGDVPHFDVEKARQTVRRIRAAIPHASPRVCH
jgi:hypothetical protein